MPATATPTHALRACLQAVACSLSHTEWHRLNIWLDTQERRLLPIRRTRCQELHVREGHGDLHLANLIRWRDGFAAFDPLEFDPALRWIDGIEAAAAPSRPDAGRPQGPGRLGHAACRDPT